MNIEGRNKATGYGYMYSSWMSAIEVLEDLGAESLGSEPPEKWGGKVFKVTITVEEM